MQPCFKVHATGHERRGDDLTLRSASFFVRAETQPVAEEIARRVMKRAFQPFTIDTMEVIRYDG